MQSILRYLRLSFRRCPQCGSALSYKLDRMYCPICDRDFSELEIRAARETGCCLGCLICLILIIFWCFFSTILGYFYTRIGD